MNDLLLPHLLDLLDEPGTEGMVLAGGFGLFLKTEHVRTSGFSVLIPGHARTRTTQDFDFFLDMSLFAPERARAFKEILDRLGYAVVENAKHYHFSKMIPQPPLTPLTVRIDLLARVPLAGEGVEFDSRRVRSPSGVHLHGRTTPEAFSVESRALALPLRGRKTNGVDIQTQVLVPHPYSWLNMKVQAAFEWLLRKREGKAEKPGSLKHLQDLYTLVALLTRTELTEAKEMAKEYSHLEVARGIRSGCEELFGKDESEGMVELREQLGHPVNAAFRPGLRQALGITE